MASVSCVSLADVMPCDPVGARGRFITVFPGATFLPLEADAARTPPEGLEGRRRCRRPAVDDPPVRDRRLAAPEVGPVRGVGGWATTGGHTPPWTRRLNPEATRAAVVSLGLAVMGNFLSARRPGRADPSPCNPLLAQGHAQVEPGHRTLVLGDGPRLAVIPRGCSPLPFRSCSRGHGWRRIHSSSRTRVSGGALASGRDRCGARFRGARPSRGRMARLPARLPCARRVRGALRRPLEAHRQSLQAGIVSG